MKEKTMRMRPIEELFIVIALLYVLNVLNV